MTRSIRTLILFTLTAARLEPAEKLRVAVMPLEARAGISQDLAIAAAGALNDALTETRRFQMVDRLALIQSIKKTGGQANGCLDPACAMKIGTLLNSQKMVLGSMIRLGGRPFVQLKFVDVQTAAQEFSVQSFAETDGEVATTMTALAAKLSQRIPVLGTVVSLNGLFFFTASVGREDGVSVGDTCHMVRYGDKREDKTTGEALGRSAEDLGTATVMAVDGTLNRSTFRIDPGAHILNVGDSIIAQTRGKSLPPEAPPATAPVTATGRATPPPVPKPLEAVRPSNNGEEPAEIQTTDLKVAGIRFLEDLPTVGLTYRSEFQRSSARYVYVEITFSNTLFNQGDYQSEFVFECLNPDGRRSTYLKSTILIPRHLPTSKKYIAWGNQTPGMNWTQSGIYKSTISKNGQVVDSAEFTMY